MQAAKKSKPYRVLGTPQDRAELRERFPECPYVVPNVDEGVGLRWLRLGQPGHARNEADSMICDADSTQAHKRLKRGVIEHRCVDQRDSRLDCTVPALRQQLRPQSLA